MKKMGCPRHGAFYPAKGCEQCAYEKEHPGLAAPITRRKVRCSRHGEIETGDECKDCRYELEHPPYTGPWWEDVQAVVGKPCRVTLEGKIERPHELGVVVRVYYQGCPEGTLMVLPKKAVTPLVKVKN